MTVVQARLKVSWTKVVALEMIPRFLSNKEGSGGNYCDGGHPGGASLSGR